MIGVGPLEGFKLVIILIRFAFYKDLPGTWLRSLGSSQAFSHPYPLEQTSGAGGSAARPRFLGTYCFSLLMCLSRASAQQKTKCADEITALRAEGQS